MQVTRVAPFDVAFDLLLPVVLIPVWLLLSYSAERAIFAGRPLTPFLKSFNLHGAVFLAGVVYLMSFTSLLGFAPRTLWMTIPIWALVFAVFAHWRYQKKSMRSGSF